MKNNNISSFLPTNKDIEEQAICFLAKNQKEIGRTKQIYFYDDLCKLLYSCIKEINDTEYKCDLNLLYDTARKKNNNFDKKEIERILNLNLNSDNIKLLFIKLKDFYTENEILKKVEIIAAKTLEKKELDRNSIKELSAFLEKDIIDLGDNENLLTTKDVATIYRQELEKREKGERIRSLGYKEIDRNVTRPAAAEEITGLVGLKGMGKSIFKLCQENNLINSNVCVVSFNPEMPLLSNIDRLIAVRSGITVYDLLKKDKDQQLKNQIEREIRRLENIPNYLYYELADLNLFSIKDKIQKAKQIFSDLKVLPDDEYMFITVDTFDMLEEFEDADPKRIRANINKFHKIIRKEKIHAEILLQANENKLRNGKIIKNAEDLDYYKIGVEDIEGGAAFAAKARLVLSLNRPVQMKKMIFAERMEEWNMEDDVLNIAGVKQNDGPLFFSQFAFNSNMRIYPLQKCERGDNVEDEE
jgi:replicative DNA helicase